MHRSYTIRTHRTTMRQVSGCFGHIPTGVTHDSSRLEDLHDLAIDAFPGGSMAGRFDGIDSIERVLSKLLSELHEVTLNEFDLVFKWRLQGILARPHNLEIVVIQPNDVCIGELRDLPGRSTDSASDIEDSHTLSQLHV